MLWAWRFAVLSKEGKERRVANREFRSSSGSAYPVGEAASAAALPEGQGNRTESDGSVTRLPATADLRRGIWIIHFTISHSAEKSRKLAIRRNRQRQSCYSDGRKVCLNAGRMSKLRRDWASCVVEKANQCCARTGAPATGGAVTPLGQHRWSPRGRRVAGLVGCSLCGSHGGGAAARLGLYGTRSHSQLPPRRDR